MNWPENPKSKLLEPDFWSSKGIKECPDYPVVLITLDNDGGVIEYYPSIGNFEVRWNHQLFDKEHIEGFSPFMIDENLSLYQLKFHTEKFIYPSKVGTIDKLGILSLLEKSKILDLKRFSNMATEKEILNELIKGNFKYHWQEEH